MPTSRPVIPDYVVEASDRFNYAPRSSDALLSAESRLLLSRGMLYPEATRAWIDRGFLEETYETRRDGRSTVSWRLDQDALRAYEIQPGERVDRLAAAWLYAARERLEPFGASSAWCTSCGFGCVDQRVTFNRVRRWCDGCVGRRHRPEFRICAASDCISYFWSTRSNQDYCSPACVEAQRRNS